MGVADLPWMNVMAETGVLTQRDILLEFAREDTATIAVQSLRTTDEGLRADGARRQPDRPDLPSGVGLRRFVIEFSVLDAKGNVLWSSGRTDRLGQLLAADGTPLPSEHYPATVYEPHHQVIRSSDDVQIYEEVVTDDLGVITTGFLNRWYDKKDNRIPPRGFRWDSMYVQAPYDVAPKGEALADPQYTRPDPRRRSMERTRSPTTSRCRRRCGSGRRAVRARLISQSIPPYFLHRSSPSWRSGKQIRRSWQATTS